MRKIEAIVYLQDDLCAIVKDLITKSGKSQLEIAKTLGIDPTYLSRILRLSKAPVKQLELERVAWYLGKKLTLVVEDMK